MTAQAFLVGDEPSGRIQFLEEKVALARHFVARQRIHRKFQISSFVAVIGCSDSELGLKRATHIFSDLQDYGKAGKYHSDDPLIDGKEFIGWPRGFHFNQDFDVRAFFQAVLTAVGE